MLEVTVDFYHDWIDILRRELTAAGYQPPPSPDPQEVCFRYFNYMKRIIPAKPRNVEKSRGFSAPPDLQAGVDAVAKKFEKGESLNAHLSTLLTDPDFDDDLLNDWGIHHLHLGTKPHPRNPAFVERTGPLLFVKVLKDRVLFLTVMPHQEFANRVLVEILHANWPDTIARYRLQGVIDVFAVPSEELKTLRKGHVSTVLKLKDGTIYAPPGGGIATSGLSVDVVQTCDYYVRLMKQLQQHVIANAQEFAKKAGIDLAKGLAFRLHLMDGSLVAVEEGANVGMKLCDL